MKFKYYPEEKLYIDSISSRLTEDEQHVRMKLMEQIISSGSPINKDIIKELSMQENLDIEEIISNLFMKKNVIAANSEGDIICVHPISALPTQHKVFLQDGRMFHAMCAIDAIGATFAFDQGTTVKSICSHCKEPISITIQDD